jgi:hypothetical protein
MKKKNSNCEGGSFYISSVFIRGEERFCCPFSQFPRVAHKFHTIQNDWNVTICQISHDGSFLDEKFVSTYKTKFFSNTLKNCI